MYEAIWHDVFSGECVHWSLAWDKHNNARVLFGSAFYSSSSYSPFTSLAESAAMSTAVELGRAPSHVK